MKKFVTILLTVAMFLGTQIFAQAVEYKYDDFMDYYYAESKTQAAIEADPMNNDLFDIVATVQSDIRFSEFESYKIQYSEDYSKARVVKQTLTYDGIGKEEVIADYMDWEEATKIKEDYDGYAEYRANGYRYPFNDGLIYTDNMTRKASYMYNDINDAYYVFFDPAYMGFGSCYNIGIMQESYSSQVFVPGQDFPEWGDPDTYIYTMFSDDINYLFLQTDFSNFDDNGYAIMYYNGVQYVIKLKKGYIPTVFYNGEKIKFDQIPVIENGRTLVPLRAIFEKIGATIDWNGDTQTITAQKEDVTVSLTINSTTAYKNGEEISLDVPSKIINGRTLVPVRFVSDCFGVGVDWDGVMQKISLTKN